MENPLSAVIGVLIGGAILAFTCAWIATPEIQADIETKQSTRHIALDGSSFHIEVVTIDEVEYVVAKTYRGVGICRK